MNIFYAGNKLSRHGVTATVIETLSLQLKGLGYSIISVSDKKNKVLRLLDMVYCLLKSRRDVSAVLIDTYSKSAFWYALALAYICKRYQLPYYLILHGGGLPTRLEKSPKLSNYLFSGSVMNIAPSPSFVDLFEKNDYKVTCIPNNIDISLYDFSFRRQSGCKLLWVRSFHRIYNPQLAIRLLHRLRELEIEAELCMVGPDKDGSMQQCRDLAQELKIVDKVKFTGVMPKKEWIKLSKCFDVFINTTNVDNTPVSVIEAMALGLPVVSTNVGGIPYLLTDKKDALLVPSDDLAAMTEAVLDTMNNVDATNQRVLEARKKAETFGWDIVKRQWKELFDVVHNN